MKTISARADIHFKKFIINSKNITLPFKITDFFIQNNFLIIILAFSLDDNDGKPLPDADETIKILYQNVWCFNAEGDLIWKSPEIYSEEDKKDHLTKFNKPLVAAYSYIDFCKTNDQHVLIGTDFGVEMEIEIATGKLIKRVHHNVK
jgi:hypothetical protein